MEIAVRRREQEVWQACDDLWALFGDAKNLTGDAIRERLVILGKSRGSPNEIYKYRKSWSHSRGLNHESESISSDDDPITRVVRMVHEKLITEADEKIEALKSAQAIELEEKNRELEQQRSDLAQVICELGTTGEELRKCQSELLTLNQQLTAETEVRKAQERELALAKTSHQQSLQELKAAHHDLCERLTQIYNTGERERLAHIERLETEKKQLGYEFSEKLTEIKTSNYNQALIINNLEEELRALKSELEHRSILINAHHTKFEAAREECSRLGTSNHHLSIQLESLKAAHSFSKKELAQAQIAAKKQELTIARLRAVRALS